MIPLILQATDSDAVYETLAVNEEEAITLDDLRGIFCCLTIGLSASSFSFVITLALKDRIKKEK